MIQPSAETRIIRTLSRYIPIMIARSIARVLLALLTLNLTVLGADFACARHSVADQSGSRDIMESASSMQMPAAVQASGTRLAGDSASTSAKGFAADPATGETANAGSDTEGKHPPCEAPSESNCCRALLSCSVVFPVNDAVVIVPVNQLRLVIALRDVSLPLSEIISPDPPPPKA